MRGLSALSVQLPRSRDLGREGRITGTYTGQVERDLRNLEREKLISRSKLTVISRLTKLAAERVFGELGRLPLSAKLQVELYKLQVTGARLPVCEDCGSDRTAGRRPPHD